jgi:hypothetical protein
MDRIAPRRIAALALSVAAFAAAVAAPAASASPGLSEATAVTAPDDAAASSSGEMTLEFTRGTALVAGPGALVRVRCTGTSARSCVGTLAIEAPGEPPEAPFSIDSGEERVVVVPLGSQRSVFGGMVSVKSRVVAHTVQATGSSLRTARTLRFK